MTATPSVGYSGSYTVEAWIKPSTTTKVYQTFFDSRSPTGEYSVDFKLTGSSYTGGQQLYADIGDGHTWLASPRMPFAYRAFRWYYVALTVSMTNEAGVATFFVDGKAVYDVSLHWPVYCQPWTWWLRKCYTNYTLPLLTDSNHPIALGGNPRYDNTTTPDPENFDGTIGQVAVYEYALSDTQVAAHYSAGRSP